MRSGNVNPNTKHSRKRQNKIFLDKKTLIGQKGWQGRKE